MFLGQQAIRENLITKVEEVAECKKASASAKEAAKAYLDTKDDTIANAKATDALIKELKSLDCDCAKEILAKKDYLSKKSVWVFGGDG